MGLGIAVPSSMQRFPRVAIVFYRARSLYGRIVSLFTRSPWSHVAILHETDGIVLVTNAFGNRGVVPMRPSVQGIPDRIFPIDNWVDPHFATEWCSQEWGRAYGWADIWGFVKRKLRLGGQHDHRGQHCGELTARFLKDALLVCRDWKPMMANRIDRLPPAHQVSPKMLMEVFDHVG